MYSLHSTLFPQTTIKNDFLTDLKSIIITNIMISATELADRFEIGDVTPLVIKTKSRYNHKLVQDITEMMYQHTFEEDMIQAANSYMHPDCHFQEYDWDAMYEEDRYCSDLDYIPKLKSRLGKECACPNHTHQI